MPEKLRYPIEAPSRQKDSRTLHKPRPGAAAHRSVSMRWPRLVVLGYGRWRSGTAPVNRLQPEVADPVRFGLAAVEMGHIHQPVELFKRSVQGRGGSSNFTVRAVSAATKLDQQPPAMPERTRALAESPEWTVPSGHRVPGLKSLAAPKTWTVPARPTTRPHPVRGAPRGPPNQWQADARHTGCQRAAGRDR